MPVTILIPSPLRPAADNQHAVQVAGATAAAAIDGLVARFPALAGSLLAEPGRLQPFVHVFLNGKDIASLAGLDTALPDGAELLIIQAISGG